MKNRTSRPSVRKSEINRIVRALRENGLQPTGAEIAPDGTVTLFTGSGGREGSRDDAAFDAWWRENGGPS